ncbi:hypothetical protein M752DRAFT_155593 [Aspergillus phoenicis ATCC 13157]|uniref:Uncharacterized protein n=1 Tax=Aspergillus phoenicis ATCC 13157 TaxID=1353007 RepID=A0A370PM87_ASPPH|nr:hypothetical protein M752DRAFT_155593 [Aspergillus phoenicis ATCC 13157]
MDEAAPLQDNHPAPKGRTPVTLRVNSPGCIVRKNGLGSSDAGGGGGRPVKARGRGRQMTRGEHLHGTCSQLAYIDRSSAVRGTFEIIGCRPNITLSRHYSAPNPAAPCLRNLDLFFFFSCPEWTRQITPSAKGCPAEPGGHRTHSSRVPNLRLLSS